MLSRDDRSSVCSNDSRNEQAPDFGEFSTAAWKLQDYNISRVFRCFKLSARVDSRVIASRFGSSVLRRRLALAIRES
jgi:hypothetical protein